MIGRYSATSGILTWSTTLAAKFSLHCETSGSPRCIKTYSTAVTYAPPEGATWLEASAYPKNLGPCLRLASLLGRGRLRTIGGCLGLSCRGLGLGVGL